jgi:hypothetical protein
MAFQDRLTVVIDFVTGPAQSGLKKLRADVAQAEGAMGKAKAAAAGLGGALQQYAGQAAFAAGAALVTFGVKSVKAFQDTALAAGKFADATGASVESASRLIEVAGDLGISGETVQGAIQRMNKAIADGKPSLDGLADSIVRAKDGSVDSAATFENLITRIGGIRDATERAKVAQEVFGRSYGEMAELMNMSAGQLARRLEDVSDQKVINQQELERARKFRDSMDQLRDRVDDAALAVGENLVPALTTVADAFGAVSTAIEATPLDEIGKFFSVGAGGWGLIQKGVDRWKQSWNNLFGDGGEVETSIKTIEYGTEAAGEMAAMYAERIPPAVEQSRVAVFRLRDATADAEAKAQDLEDQWATLFGTLDDQEALLNLQDQFDQLYAAGVEAYAAGVEGSDNAAEAQKRHQQAIIDTKREIATYAKEVLGLPVERVTKILADIDEGKLDQIERQLQILSRNRTMNLSIIAKGGAGYDLPFGGRRAQGGPVQPGKAYVVGEEGPEVIVPSQSGMVIPNGGTRAITSGAAAAAPMVVNITTGADPEDVVRAIERYKRRNGSLPFI